MAAHTQRWEAIVGLWYAAGFGEVPWRRTLRATAELLDGAGSAFFELDRATGQIGLFEVDRLEPGAGEYVERMNEINPRMRHSLAHPSPHVVTDLEILSEAEIARHEFYDWMERTNGTRYFVGARIADAGSRSLFASVEFDRRRGNPDHDRVALFQRLAPHIGNAWRIARLAGAVAGATDLVERLAGSRLCGVVGLAADARIVLANPAAEATLRRGDGLIVADRRVSALRSAADRTLQALIGRALDGDGGLAAIPRAGGGPPLAVRAMPTAVGVVDHRLPAVLLLISDPEQAPAPGAGTLRMLGLTEGEARIAAALVRGHTLAGSARRLGISHNTARAHLRNIFAKTGMRSQIELVRVLCGLAALDGAVADNPGEGISRLSSGEARRP
jgi:DNA-binding CsgD family transcriptional regulator